MTVAVVGRKTAVGVKG